MTIRKATILEWERELAISLGINFNQVCHVGSSMITGEPGNDKDFLVLIPASLMLEILPKAGYERDITDHYFETCFESWRKGDTNLVVVWQTNVFYSEMAISLAAREACRGNHDLNTREGRVAFHGEIRMELQARGRM